MSIQLRGFIAIFMGIKLGALGALLVLLEDGTLDKVTMRNGNRTTTIANDGGHISVTFTE